MHRPSLYYHLFRRVYAALCMPAVCLLAGLPLSAQSGDGRIEIPADQIPCICPSGGMGSITVIAEGSAGPFTFLWAGPGGYASTEQNPADLPAPGWYTVAVTNAYGCAVTLEAEVPACDGVPEPVLEVEGTCEGGAHGSIGLVLPGGDAGFSYAWSNGSTTRDLAGLEAGVYSVTITNSGGCTRIVEVIVPGDQVLQLSAQITGACQGQTEGSIELTVAGGQAPYTFQWSNGWPLQSLGPVPSGVYKVTVSNGAAGKPLKTSKTCPAQCMS